MLTSSIRSRWVFLPLTFTLATLFIFLLRLPLSDVRQRFHLKPKPKEPKPLVYKPEITDIPPPLPEYFSTAAKATGPEDLPPIPSWNQPPAEHVPESTRLYIGFTRYWPLLQQVVVSYITAGWPPEDIYVVENTGTFDANKNGQLTSQNPFYMDYHRLTKIFGVNVITMHSLQTFSQLQNFYLSNAIENNLTHYFWGHMDVAVLSHENEAPYKSLYMRAVDVVREVSSPEYMKNEDGTQDKWAIQFFAYDWLAMVNVQSFKEIGAWDPMVNYYGTDCDMHSRLAMGGYKSPVRDAGEVFDMIDSLPDLEIFYRGKPLTPEEEAEYADKDRESEEESIRKRQDNPVDHAANNPDPPIFASPSSSPSPSPTSASNPDTITTSPASDRPSDSLNSTAYHHLHALLKHNMHLKQTNKERNSWQHTRQKGGKGEPFYYDPEGWEKALQMTIETGARINEEKWGHKGCDLKGAGRHLSDMWRVEHDETFD